MDKETLSEVAADTPEPASESRSELLSGTIFGDYEIIELIGSGGSSRVCNAGKIR